MGPANALPIEEIRLSVNSLKFQNGGDVVNKSTEDILDGGFGRYDEDEGSESDEREITLSRVANAAKRRCLSVDKWRNTVPITKWLPRYSKEDFHGDLVAGITVALTVIPQGLALATLANLPPQYGLYTAFMGSFVYTLFGSCKDLTIGPTAIMSIMTGQYVKNGGPAYAVLLSFLAGIVQLILGILNLGFVVEFISGSVISGFTSAAAITIAGTQVKGLLGVNITAEHFVDVVIQFFSRITTIKLADSLLGVGCVVALLTVRHYKDRRLTQPGDASASVFLRILDSIWFTISTGRNVVTVLICAAAAAILDSHGYRPFALTGVVEGGLPSFQPPPFSVDYFDPHRNVTVHRDFNQMVSDLGIGIFVIAFLSILEGIAIAKAFAKGKHLDATQELIAIGMCNVAGSFVSAYPSTGSFSRTAINNNSGVRTPLGGVFTGLIVIAALQFLSPYFRFIPVACLSAIIITAVIFMVHYQDVIIMWRTNKMDLIPFSATFFSAFFLGLEYGIMIGFTVAMVFLLYQNARPVMRFSIEKTISGRPYPCIKPDRSILFPSAMYSTAKIIKLVETRRPFADKQHGGETPEPLYVVLDGTHLMTMDYTTALAIKSLCDGFRQQNTTLVFVNLRVTVARSLRGALQDRFYYCRTDKDLDKLVGEHSFGPVVNYGGESADNSHYNTITTLKSIAISPSHCGDTNGKQAKHPQSSNDDTDPTTR